MRYRFSLAGSLPCLVLVCLLLPGGPARAEVPALHLIPRQADVVAQVKEPRRLVEAVLNLDALKALDSFAPVRELQESTNFRRFRQLVAYFEREMGQPWPALLDGVAGNGIALGVKLGPNPAPALLVIEGKDEKLVKKFARLGMTVLEQELSRQESQTKLTKGSYEGIDTYRAGKDLHLAVAGKAILLSNNEKVLHLGLDLQRGKATDSHAGNKALAEVEKMLPPGSQLSIWLNMDTVRQGPGAKNLYKQPRDDPNLTVLFGAIIDVLGRTPFVCAGLTVERGGLHLAVRAPRGREGMGADMALHVPPASKPGSRPLLQPKGTFFCDSYYLNVASIWNERTKLFNDKQAKALEQADKSSGRFLSAFRISKLLNAAGPYQRIVVANQERSGYAKYPKQNAPAFAFVLEMRDPDAFYRTVEGGIRAGVLFLPGRVGLKLVEEKHGGSKIVGYRFPEDKPLKEDAGDIRFNFSPCFTRVGDQFVLCSTIELCRELVDALEKEGTAPERGAPATVQMRGFAEGFANLLDKGMDALITQTILDQSVSLDEARGQAGDFIALVKKLGNLRIESRYTDRQFGYDIRIGVVK